MLSNSNACMPLLTDNPQDQDHEPFRSVPNQASRWIR
jgi:hypothetical protein